MSEITKSIGVSYERTNPVPLDKSAIAENDTDAEAILSSPTAYNGQVVITEDGNIHAKTSTTDNALCATTPVVFQSSGEDNLYTDYYKRILAEGTAGGKNGFMHTRFGTSWIDVCTGGGLLRQRDGSHFPYEPYATEQVTVTQYQSGHLMFKCKLPSSSVQYRVRGHIELKEKYSDLSACCYFEFDLGDNAQLIVLPKFDDKQYALLPEQVTDDYGTQHEGLALVSLHTYSDNHSYYNRVGSLSDAGISRIRFCVTEICANTSHYSG